MSAWTPPAHRSGSTGTSRRGAGDEPDTFGATYAPVAVDGDVVVAQGTTTYRKVPGGPIHQVYDNCFVIRFDEQGLCREFTEFYVLRPSGG